MEIVVKIIIRPSNPECLDKEEVKKELEANINYGFVDITGFEISDLEIDIS